MWQSLLFSLPLFLSGSFDRQVLHGDFPAYQEKPGVSARWADTFWKKLTLLEIAEYEKREKDLLPLLAEIQKNLPATETPSLDFDSRKTSLKGTYGILPEIFADREVPAIFPQPIHPPGRTSWFQAAQQMARTLETLRAAERAAHRKDPHALQTWGFAHPQYEKAAAFVRHLQTWIPSIEKGTAATPSSLRPQRIIQRPFLPETLVPGSTLSVPLYTDISQTGPGAHLRKEFEAAVDSYWTRSPWARQNQIRFEIHWRQIPEDPAFARGETDLAAHIAKFPPHAAGLTTGGATNFVRGHVLVLSPAKITVRSLAHEFGHLLGFEDCYLRTLNSQGLAGAFGLAILEWDNPLYPDDLMCDDQLGVARSELW